nr:hypothetical protein [Microbacterium barkeri]
MMLRIEMNGAATGARLTASSAAKTTSDVPRPANQNGKTVTDPSDQARLKRLQGVRLSMELLHAEALTERGGRTFTTEETLALIRRSDLIIETTTSLTLDILKPSPANLKQAQDEVDGCVTVQEAIEKAKRSITLGDG